MSRPHLYVVRNDASPESTSSGDATDRHNMTESRQSARRQKIDRTSVPQDWQLPLPFNDEPAGPTVLIVSMETMNGTTLRRLINDRRPNSAVDLRELIRFDLPGTSRDDVFRALQINHTHYVKDPLPWHQLDARAWAKLEGPVSTALVHEIVEREAQCVMVLVYRSGDALSIAGHLNKVLSERMKRPWHIEEAS